jgi:hypothetical protein
VIRGAILSLPDGPTLTVEVGAGREPRFRDIDDPPPWSGYYYLVRAENACGAGPIGH